MVSEKSLKTKLASSRKISRSAVGAPSQHNQSSRKGKKAWRKNVDIEEVEQGLEGLRQEERVTGTILQKIKDSDLFTVDLTGDEQIRKTMPRYSAAQLTSTKILAQRSAVPAVFSRTTTTSTTTGKRKLGLSREERDRLMRITKRPRKGPFNSIMDPSEYAAGSGTVALSEAVKSSGAYDPWVPQSVEEVKDGLETVQEKKFKPPVSTKQRDLIDVPAIVEPHHGTSYNPPVDAHQELLLKAAAVEEKRLKDVEKLAAVKVKMDNALQESSTFDTSAAAGMTVAAQTDDEGAGEEAGDLQGSPLPTKLQERKTKAQKNKAARVLAEKRALIQRAERKRLLASIGSVKQLRKSNSELLSIREKEREQKRLALAEKLRKQGLAGQKLGKHKVPESELIVQLGEDLSESLRGLKPEGNLFRDRFQSLQQRALIEPRAIVLPKKRRHKMIEYEKHAWKRFE